MISTYTTHTHTQCMCADQIQDINHSDYYQIHNYIKIIIYTMISSQIIILFRISLRCITTCVQSPAEMLLTVLPLNKTVLVLVVKLIYVNIRFVQTLPAATVHDACDRHDTRTCVKYYTLTHTHIHTYVLFVSLRARSCGLVSPLLAPDWGHT